jgi:hypothetical protein
LQQAHSVSVAPTSIWMFLMCVLVAMFLVWVQYHLLRLDPWSADEILIILFLTLC